MFTSYKVCSSLSKSIPKKKKEFVAKQIPETCSTIIDLCYNIVSLADELNILFQHEVCKSI